MKKRIKLFGVAFALAACGLFNSARGQDAAQPQQPDERGVREQRVALTEAATAFDAEGRAAVAARLVTTNLAATAEAPLRNVSLIVENRSPYFYNYASGWATFYDGRGVRCGEGLWKVEAFAPAESAEVDTPGLRLTCSPASWRVVALNLLTRTTDIAKPSQPAPPSVDSTAAPPSVITGLANPQRLEININGRTLPLQLNNPLEIVVGQERVRIVVREQP